MDKELLEKLRGIEGSAKKATIAAATLLSVEAQATQTDSVYNQELENPNHKIEMTQEAPPKIDEPAFDFNDYRTSITIQPDTVTNDAFYQGFYAPDRDVIVQAYNEDKPNEFQLDNSTTAVHEYKHQLDYKAGVNDYDLNFDQVYTNQHDRELAAELGTFVALRQYHLDNPEEKVKEGPMRGLVNTYFYDAKFGEIDPLSQDPIEEEKDKRYIYEKVRDFYEKSRLDLYHETNISKAENGAVISENNDENAQKVTELLFDNNLGGFEFSDIHNEYPKMTPEYYKETRLDNNMIEYINEKNPYQEGMNIEDWHTLNIYAMGAYKIENNINLETNQSKLDTLNSAEVKSDMVDYYLQDAMIKAESKNLNYVYDENIKNVTFQGEANPEMVSQKAKEMYNIGDYDFSNEIGEYMRPGNMSEEHISAPYNMGIKNKNYLLPNQKPTQEELSNKAEANLVDKFYSSEIPETPKYFEHSSQRGGMRAGEPIDVEIYDLSTNFYQGSKPALIEKRDMLEKQKEEQGNDIPSIAPPPPQSKSSVANKLLELSGQREAPSEPKPVNKTQLTQEQFQEMISQKNDLTQ